MLALCQADGADFDALMTEYNGDTVTGDLLTKGYPVSATATAYVDAFTGAAMALEKIGDISGLV